jgi:hypothetical protein
MKSYGASGLPDLVDASDLSLLATGVQTIVITLTLLVFIFQFRSQEKSIRESSYQSVLGRYGDYIMSGSSADEQLLANLFSTTQKLSTEDLAAVRRLMIAYGIIEEAFELYKKRWIDKETWEQWAAWLKAISKHPLFSTLHVAIIGMFDKDFQEYVTRLLGSDPSQPKE